MSLGAIACTASAEVATESASPTTQSPSSTPSPSPTPPPKPKVKEARVEGRFSVTYVLLSADIPGTEAFDRIRWRMRPLCPSKGACDVVVTSANGWHARAAFLKGGYQFSRTIKKAYTCGSGDDVDYYIDATYDYAFRVSQMKLIDNEWRATKFKGIFHAKGSRGCGLSGPPEERDAIRANLLR